MEALWAIGGVVVGLVGGALVALAVARSQSQGLRERAERAEAERDEARKGFDSAKAEASESVAQARGLQATLDAERNAKGELLAQIQGTQEDFEKKIKSLALEALQENNKAFVNVADTRLKPLEDQLRLYEEGLQKLRDTGTRQTTETQEHIKHLVGELHKQRELAGDIKSLLRGPTQRGRMGELMLSTLLERAGLLSGHHYELQSSSEIEGSRRRPDCKVFMPGGHGIVIDSKTPLNAYEDAMECEDEAARAAKMLEHARNVRREIDSLASKEYRREAGEGAIVVMYLPIEASLSAAILQDPEITSYGWDRGVIVTSPTLLFVLLQTVATGWRQEQFRQNTEKVAELGKELVTRVRIVANYMNKLGKNLGDSVNSYNDAIGSMDRNLMATASKFKQLGVGGDAVPELKSSTAHVRTFDKPELGVPPEESEARALTDLFLEVETVEPIPVAEAD